MSQTFDSESFHQAVLIALRHIPAGKVVAYGQLAAMAGYPGYARRVSKVLGSLHNDSTLAWHRVIRSDGSIAFAIETGMYAEQRQRLASEGVLFKGQKVEKRFFF